MDLKRKVLMFLYLLTSCAGGQHQVVPGFSSEKVPPEQEKQIELSLKKEKKTELYFSYPDGNNEISCPDNSFVYAYHPIIKKIECVGGVLNTIRKDHNQGIKISQKICDHNYAMSSLFVQKNRISKQKCRMILQGNPDFNFYTIKQIDAQGKWSCHDFDLSIGYELNAKGGIQKWHCLSRKQEMNLNKNQQEAFHLTQISNAELRDEILNADKVSLKTKFFSFGFDYLLMVKNRQIGFIRAQKAVTGLKFSLVDGFGRVVLEAEHHPSLGKVAFTTPGPNGQKVGVMNLDSMHLGQGELISRGQSIGSISALDQKWYRTYGVFDAQSESIYRFYQRFHFFRTFYQLEKIKDDPSLSPLMVVLGVVSLETMRGQGKQGRQALGRHLLRSAG